MPATSVTQAIITVGDLRFTARFEDTLAPRTCQAFRGVLPFSNRLIQTRWSGEAAWVPLGELELGIGAENATSHPARGDVLFYPAGASETELLIAYGSCCFSSKVGQLAGDLGALERVVKVGLARLDVAKPAAPRAGVSENHERRRAALPALTDVRTVGFLADGVKAGLVEFALDRPVALATRRRHLEPLGLAVAEGPDLAELFA